MIYLFICLECNKVFEEPIRFYGEWLEHFGTPCRESFTASPCCESDYTEAEKCEICGEYTEYDSGYIICNKCLCTTGDED